MVRSGIAAVVVLALLTGGGGVGRLGAEASESRITIPAVRDSAVAASLSATTASSSTKSLLGLWNNGTPASALRVTMQVYSDYAHDPDLTRYSASNARKAKGKLLMLGVGALTRAQATAIGRELASGGQPNAIIRPMWEMNQANFFPKWNERAMSPATYKARWIAMVKAFRTVPGTDFQFDYNISAGNESNLTGRSTFDSYPGNAYVNYIGIDVYDGDASLSEVQTDFTEAAHFAKAKKLRLTIPEWGLSDNVDDPAFVTLIHSNCHTSTCYEEGLFSGLSSGAGTSILNDPKSLRAYRKYFG